MGTITNGGGLQRLAHAGGDSHAMEPVLMGSMWSTQEAAAWGMVRMMRAFRMLIVRILFTVALKPGLESELSLDLHITTGSE